MEAETETFRFYQHGRAWGKGRKRARLVASYKRMALSFSASTWRWEEGELLVWVDAKSRFAQESPVLYQTLSGEVLGYAACTFMSSKSGQNRQFFKHVGSAESNLRRLDEESVRFEMR